MRVFPASETPATFYMAPVTSTDACPGCVLGYLATSLTDNPEGVPRLKHVVTRQPLERADVLRLVHALDAGPYGVVAGALAELHTGHT
jgi:hypothetical protein